MGSTRRVGEPSNHLPIDLYRRLIPRVQEEDQASGAHGYVLHWDDPDAAWDTGDPLTGSWNSVGLSPVIQELFFVIEKTEGEEITFMESVKDLVDPLKAPLSALPLIAASLGYALDESVSEAHQRSALLGLIDAYRSRGEFISWKVFYRMIGLEIVNVYALWKASINEAAGDYSRVRYQTSPVVGAYVGPAATTAFTGALADTPIKPGTLRINTTVGVTPVVIRDDGEGSLIGPTTESGTIDYVSGAFTLTLTGPAATTVTASLEQITKEWPYHAARIDVDVLLSPGGVPIPLVDGQAVDRILSRMEDIRPIHVLLRSLALVAEIDDDFGADGQSGATDKAACNQRVRDQRDGDPFPGPPGRDYNFMLDQAVRGDDETLIEELPLVGTGSKQYVFEDQAAGVCPLDTLVLHRTDGSPDVYA